ncbi:MAG: phosphatase PAP2 family protein [Coriobacteriales bacterium]|nr:phosphatase PAP2 family protein [Coriobacteriales bacterium]
MFEILNKNKHLLISAVAFVVFLAVVQDVRQNDIFSLDESAFNLFVLTLRRPWLTSIMEGFSNLSSPVVIGGMLIMVAAFAPGRRPGACAALNLVCVVGINQMLKYIVQRPRPEGFRLISEVGYSFPSGHSMVSMAFYGLCAWMVWNYERDRMVRWLCCVAYAFMVVGVGMSRVYLGVHYASDVIAGFCISIIWTVIYIKVVCPLFMPEEAELHAEVVANPVYVEPERLYVADDTSAMRARHMRWQQEAGTKKKEHLARKDDPS